MWVKRVKHGKPVLAMEKPGKTQVFTIYHSHMDGL
jgi:hypothetical protein